MDVIAAPSRPPIDFIPDLFSLGCKVWASDQTSMRLFSGWTELKIHALYPIESSALEASVPCDCRLHVYMNRCLVLFQGPPHHVGISLDREPGPTSAEVCFSVRDRHRFPVIRASVNDEAGNKLRGNRAMFITSETAESHVSSLALNKAGRPCAFVTDEGADAVFEDVLFEYSGTEGGCSSSVEHCALRFACEGRPPVKSGRLLLSVSPSDCVTRLRVQLASKELDSQCIIAPNVLACGSPLPLVQVQTQNSTGNAAGLSGTLLKESLELTLLSPSGQVLLPNSENNFVFEVSAPEENELTVEVSKPASLALTEGGKYLLKILYTEKRPDLLLHLSARGHTVAHDLVFEVEPGAPHRLQIKHKPLKPIVVHVGKDRRTEEDGAVECFPCIAVEVVDQYGNRISLAVWKKPIEADVLPTEAVSSVPRLENSGRLAHINDRGCALFPTLCLSQGCAGKCAAACKLQFSSGRLEPDDVTLFITDDMELKRKIALKTEQPHAEAKKLASLKKTMWRAEMARKERLAEKTRSEKVRDAMKERLPGEDRSALAEGRTIQELFRQHGDVLDAVPGNRRPCADRSAERKVAAVSGFIGLLCDMAEVEDEDKARVISWFLGRERLEIVVCRSETIMAMADMGDGFCVMDTALVNSFEQAGPGKLQLALPHGGKSLPEVGRPPVILSSTM
jgi:hypothetical protein